MSTAKQRRLKKELERLEKKTHQVSFKDDTIFIQMQNPYTYMLKIVLGPHYPFYCPEIMINDLPYKEVLTLTRIQNKVYQTHNENVCCLICSSLVCKHNWNVCKTIEEIIMDVENHLKKKQEIQFLEIWQKVQIKYEIPLSGRLQISQFF